MKTKEQKRKSRADYMRAYWAKRFAAHPEIRLAKNAYNKRYRETHADSVKEWYANRPKDAKRRWWAMRGGSKQRKIECTIDFETYLEITKDGVCFYCKKEIAETMGHRLDRKDNAKGYTPENVVPCCAACNRMKSTVLSFDETCYLMPLLLEYRKRKNEQGCQDDSTDKRQ